MKPRVLIFTKRVLPISNTFVASVGNSLQRHDPVFAGLRLDSSGLSLINNQVKCIQAEHETFPRLSRLLIDGFRIVTPSWSKALAAHNATLIHANFGKGGYYSSAIASKLDIPLMTTFHGSDITQKDKFSYNSRHRKIVFERSTKIIAASKFIQNRLLQAGCPSDKIIQNYIGIDTSYFKPGGNKSSYPTVLFVGRLIEQKGCQYLLKAMDDVQSAIPEARLLIAGYGTYSSNLKKLASHLKHVSFLGAQSREQVKTLMSEAWITCLPSIRMARGNEEGLAMVALESQAVGSPVAAFDTGGVGEGISHEVTGLLSEERDWRDLAKNIVTLLSSDQLRQEMGQQGVRRVKELFSIEIQTEKLENIYDDIS